MTPRVGPIVRRVARRISLGLLPFVLLLAACAPPPAPRHLVFISLDTVRRDHLPLYGYSRDTAPALGELAGRSIVFDNAYSQETNTNPSHTSMFTGLYPHVHGSLDNRWLLREGQVTLAQILRGASFRTAAFVSGLVMSRELTGLERGFEIYEDQVTGIRREGRETTQLALEWLAARDPEERYFLFLHLYDAHGPYQPSAEYETRFVSEDRGPLVKDLPGYQVVEDARGRTRRGRNGYIDRYDCQLRYLDDRVADVLASVDLSDTLVVVLSDHGESLAERFHKFDHGGQVFDEQIRIPLIVAAPGLRARRVEPIVETVDLLPTLLELLGVELPADLPIQGASLVPLMRGVSEEGRQYTFSSARARTMRHADRGYALNPRRRILAIRSADWKLIRYPGRDADPLELYNVHSDPGESHNVVLDHDDLVSTLMDQLRRWESLATDPRTGPAEVDTETLEGLRALGYVQ